MRGEPTFREGKGEITLATAGKDPIVCTLTKLQPCRLHLVARLTELILVGAYLGCAW